MIRRRLEKYLQEWKDKTSRKPLILRGARQVGKTSLLKKFGKEQFENIVYINLENPEHARPFSTELTLDEFEAIVKISLNQQLINGKTLVFFDEIQNSPTVIKMLRFFYEERPDLHIVCAGSLLEAKINNEGFSFPVGRVEFAFLYPLDFFEFLEAKQEGSLLDYLENHRLDQAVLAPVHEKALLLFKEYSMIGGMPEAVAMFLSGDDFSEVKKVFSQIFFTYSEDLNKYVSMEKVKYLQHVLDYAPLYAGGVVSYQNFGESSYKFREMSEAFLTLEKVMILRLLPATNSKRLPLLGKQKRPKKMIFLDVGFTNYFSDLFESYLQKTSIDNIYQGKIMEQVIGQNILAQFHETDQRIYYWAKEKSEGTAEVDFSLVIDGKIIGIEARSGQKRNSKSLMVFKKEVENSVAIRLWSKNVELNPQLVSLPVYFAPRVREFGGVTSN